MENTTHTHMTRRALVTQATLLAASLGLFTFAGSSIGQESASSPQSNHAGQPGSPNVSVEGLPISSDTTFSCVFIEIPIEDFNAAGFTFGDSVDIVFTNGFELRDIPYYNGYYGDVGDYMLVGYPGASRLKATQNYGTTLWDTAGLSDSDTATITLREAGRFLVVQEAFDMSYTNDRTDYDSDEQFANFRACTGGRMRPDTVYRSASPIDNMFNRAPYVETLMRDASVAYSLDLSDSPDEVSACIVDDEAAEIDVSYFVALCDSGCVAMLDLTSSFPSEEFAETLVGGLIDMSAHEGPYLVHCVEGKDRTGFVCALLEALCGASYAEMLADYMETYANYYGVTLESDPDKYAAISDITIDGMLRYLASVEDGTDLSAIDFTEPARDYLRAGGMTDEQIDALAEKIT